MKRSVVIAVIVVVVLAAGGGYRLLRQKEEKTEAGERYERVAVTRDNIRISIQTTATIRPRNRLEIKPPIAGRVEEVLVSEGDEVKTGQIIAWMSSTERAALLDAARARGEAELARWQDVYKATPLVAPLDGTIIARDVEAGQTVTASDTLLVLSDRLMVEAQVDETDLAHIQVGRMVRVELDAYPGQDFAAKVTHISYEAETVENVTIYKVEVESDKMPEFVRSGMTASVTFSETVASNVLVIPAEALHDEGGRKVAWLPPSGSMEGHVSREVVTGATDGRNVEIRDGLNEGDVVLAPRVQMERAAGEQKTNPFMPTGPKRTSRSSGGGGPPPP